MADLLNAAAPAQMLAAGRPKRRHLTVCLPLVFLIGTPTLLITRYVYWLHYPQEFVGTSPTISGTASVAPTSDIFQWAILAAVVCIIVTWSLELGMVRHRLRTHLPEGPTRADLWTTNTLACWFGIAAGIFLGALAVVDLGSGNSQHMLYSVLFFVTQVLAFVLDSLGGVKLRRLCPGLTHPSERLAIVGKIGLAGISLTGGLFFLFIFAAKDIGLFADRYAVQQVYVLAEYGLCILLFAYPLPCYLEIRRHYRQRRPVHGVAPIV